LVVRTAQATQDTTHLEHLVRERLNRTTLAAPVVRTGLVVDATEPLASGTHPLLATANLHTGWDRHELLERLVSRLGQGQVRQGQWQADPRPEHTHPWHPCTAEGPARAPTERLWPADWASQPPWLVDPPLRLSTQGERPVYQGPLTLLTSAQRVETGWWHTEATQRDYFVASSPQAGLVWVYRERGAGAHGGWYLQGLYG
jgi:protein ImuB